MFLFCSWVLLVAEKMIFNFNLTEKDQKTVSVWRSNLKCYVYQVLKLECTLIMPVAGSDIRIIWDISYSVLTAPWWNLSKPLECSPLRSPSSIKCFRFVVIWTMCKSSWQQLSPNRNYVDNVNCLRYNTLNINDISGVCFSIVFMWFVVIILIYIYRFLFSVSVKIFNSICHRLKLL
jgi:hypothetical protein